MEANSLSSTKLKVTFREQNFFENEQVNTYFHEFYILFTLEIDTGRVSFFPTGPILKIYACLGSGREKRSFSGTNLHVLDKQKNGKFRSSLIYELNK